MRLDRSHRERRGRKNAYTMFLMNEATLKTYRRFGTEETAVSVPPP